MRRSRDNGIAAYPALVGAMTVLVAMVAVFLSYNANQGLPFVPSYGITVKVPDAGGIQKGRDVRIGGLRVGTVESVRAILRGKEPYAEAKLKIEERFGPLKSDSVVTVRPLSPLGLKYIEVRPGRRGKTLPQDSTLPLRQGRVSVDLAATLGSFEAGKREVGGRGGSPQAELARRGTGLVGLGTALAGPVAALAGVAPASAELGTGVAGRGPDFNQALAAAPGLLKGVEQVSRNLADPRTDLHGFIVGAARVAQELADAGPALGGMVDAGSVTFAALSSEREALGESISLLPGTETAGTRALVAARPLLSDATAFLRDARPGLRVLRPASRDLHLAVRRGIPVLRRTPPLARRLSTALDAVDRLARDPAATATLTKLRATGRSLLPTLEFLVPPQTRCNYMGVWVRNAASTVSEGDRTGTWLRFMLLLKPNEMLPQDEPVPDLHVNPYANTGAPGQGGECEAGREPYLPGQRIGHTPGFQGGFTESTDRRSTVPPEEAP